MNAVRAASIDDAEVLARLRYEFRAGLDRPRESEAEFVRRCRPWMHQRLQASPHWRCWVAEQAGLVAGTIWLQLIEKLPNPVAEPETHGYVSSLYVQPGCRGHGLGSSLLATCLGVCDGLNLDAVVLWPTPQSRGLYLRQGFREGNDLLQRRR